MRPLKRIHVRMIPPEGHREDSYTFKAPPGRRYMEASEDEVIEKVVDYLDKKYPWWEFKMVKVGWGRYNFVYDGLREEACKDTDIGTPTASQSPSSAAQVEEETTTRLTLVPPKDS